MSYELGTTASPGYSDPITESPAIGPSSGGFLNPPSQPAVSSSTSGFYNPPSRSHRITSNTEVEAACGIMELFCKLCCLSCDNCGDCDDCGSCGDCEDCGDCDDCGDCGD